MKKSYLLIAQLLLAACSQSSDQSANTLTNTPATAPTFAPAPTSFNTNVPAGSYTLEKTHASLMFRVDHLGFSKYTAQFKTFNVDLEFDPAHVDASTINTTIDASSLDLVNPPTGFIETLLSEQWLNAKQFPVIEFKSTKVEVTSENSMTVTGDLTLHGVSKPVALDVKFNGGYAGHPMDPNARIGFSAAGSFKRSDFGITFGIPAKGSTMGVSDAVDVMIEAEFSGPPFASK
jgi:polyisoprenoid-binding protein YceI